MIDKKEEGEDGDGFMIVWMMMYGVIDDVEFVVEGKVQVINIYIQKDIFGLMGLECLVIKLMNGLYLVQE